jgi:hypothetical protein
LNPTPFAIGVVVVVVVVVVVEERSEMREE